VAKRVVKRRRTSTARQRLQWRLNKAEQRQRARHPLFPDSKKKDPIESFPTPLPVSVVYQLAAELKVKGDKGHHGRTRCRV